MAALRKYKFRVLVMFPAAGGSVPQRHTGKARLRCVIQPREGVYLPAVIWGVKPALPGEEAVPAVLSVALADGEAGDYLSAGQSFSIWSDVLVGDFVRGAGLAGQGAIVRQESLPAAPGGQRAGAKGPAAGGWTQPGKAGASAPAEPPVSRAWRPAGHGRAL